MAVVLLASADVAVAVTPAGVRPVAVAVLRMTPASTSACVTA